MSLALCPMGLLKRNGCLEDCMLRGDDIDIFLFVFILLYWWMVLLISLLLCCCVRYVVNSLRRIDEYTAASR